jgi:protein-S-isoprenylcysteine O-methyltransferase Ste14
MKAAARKIFLGCVQVAVAFGIIFAPAGTLRFWQAWVYLFFTSALSVSLFGYLRRKDPQLLERRRRGPWGEKEVRQKLLHYLALLIFLGTFVLSSLDHRFAWSSVPLAVEIAGYAFVAIGYLIYFVVFSENTYSGATIEVTPDQKVISTGPYSVVRHPMYAGLLVMLLGTPLALGSWWGLVMVIPMAVDIVLRILYEERFLTANLPGYADYRRMTRCRLVPSIW